MLDIYIHQIFISTDTNYIITAVIKRVGGTPWRQVYSNGSILDPFVVSVWVENPGNCVPNVLMIQCWWLSEGSNNKLEPSPVVSRPANCHRAAVSSSELLVTFHMSGERSAMWRITEAASCLGPTARSVGRTENKIITQFLQGRCVTAPQDRFSFPQWLPVKHRLSI